MGEMIVLMSVAAAPRIRDWFTKKGYHAISHGE